MAEVWHAHDETLDRDVAVKILHSHLADDSDFIERFRREAVAVARLSHPNVVTVYDTGVENIGTAARPERRAYIVMELLRGATLRTLMNSAPEERPTLRDAVRIAAEVGEGLSYAHRNGVIHRDVKPANIFVETSKTAEGALRYGRVRVVDFGIAKGVGSEHTGEDLTKLGSILGTAKYVSPEQVEGGNVDARSDVYGLGIVLYEMVTGQVPFVGANDMATALQHVRTPLRPARALRPDLSPALDAIISKSLAKQPSDRFSDVAQFVGALRTLDPRRLDIDDAVPLVTRTPNDVTPVRGIGEPHSSARSNDFGSDATRTVASGTARRVDGADRRTSVAPAQDGNTRIQSDTSDHNNADATSPRRDTRSTRRAVGRTMVVFLPLAGLLSGAFVGTRSAQQRVTPSTKSVPYIEKIVVDPIDDGEHEDELQFLDDKSTETAWTTQGYTSPNLNGKGGVGVAFSLESESVVSAVDVVSLSEGWTAQIYMRNQYNANIEEWGAYIGQRTEIGRGKTRIPVKLTKANYVLLWITYLGDKEAGDDFYRVRIGDVKVRGPAD